MRRTLLGVALILMAGSGCKNGFGPRPGPGPAPVGVANPTTEQLVTHLNDQARGIKSIQSDKVTIAIKDGITFTVYANMVYEKPRQFRLIANKSSKTVGDVGSNDKEFWFWFKDLKDADSPLAYCSYEDLPKVRNLTLPIQPDWIAEALCVSEFGPANQYEMKAVGQNLELSTQTTTPQGQKVVKTTIVSNAGNNRGRIIGHRLRDERGNEIWSADIAGYQNAGGFAVPRAVTIRQGGQKAEFSLTLNDVKVNNLNVGPDIFKRPNYGNEVNLARANGSPLGAPQSLEKVRGSGQ